MKRSARRSLVLLNSAGLMALLGGFLASGRFKSCEEDRTRRIFYEQHAATASAVTLLMAPRKANAKTGDFDDTLYNTVERARRDRDRFAESLADRSCQPWDVGSQSALCLSAALQTLSGLLSILWASKE